MSISLPQTRCIGDAGTSIPVKYAAISAASSGDNTLVAAVTAKKILVLNTQIICADIVSVTFKSGASTSLTGAMSFAAKGGMVLPFVASGHFVTAAGEALVMGLSSAVQVSGSLAYIEVD